MSAGPTTYEIRTEGLAHSLLYDMTRIGFVFNEEQEETAHGLLKKNKKKTMISSFFWKTKPQIIHHTTGQKIKTRLHYTRIII